MALSDEQIEALFLQGDGTFLDAGRTVEAAVRKDCEPLIRQMLEALKLAQRQHALVWATPSVEIDGAIAAARAWLEGNG